jgi:hypothetical protein
LRCTLFSPVVDRQAIEAVRNVLAGWSLELEGEPEQWTAARFMNPRGTFVLTSQEFTAPQDSFSKLLLGTSGYFWRRDDLSASTKKDILRFVGRTRWLLGIVGTTEGIGLSEDVFLEAALELARRVGGKLFTGTEFITPESTPETGR